MGDERHANPEYAEDVEGMMLEYLIYSTTKACIDDFMTRRDGEVRIQPSQSVLTQFNILDGFLRNHKARNTEKGDSRHICLWLELLQLVVLTSYRQVDSSPSPASVTSVLGQGQEQEVANTSSRPIDRRKYWLSTRENTFNVTAKEKGVYGAWHGYSDDLLSKSGEKLASRPTTVFSSMTPIFLAVSARIAVFVNQSISEQWVELAGQFMLQAALELCLTPGRVTDVENPVALAFSWGWIQPRFWEDYNRSSDNISGETEAMINKLFEDGDGAENRMWRETRVKYMSLLSISRSPAQSADIERKLRLKETAAKYPVHKFDKEVMIFCKGMLGIIPRPLLVQIEQGGIEGMTNDEFVDFKKRVFLPL